jgi:hypothetical protein
MKTFILAAIILSLTGCAGLQQAFDAGAAAAAVSLRAAEDSNIRLWSFNACATPLSAAIRNSQIIPALRALCIPGGGQSSPVLLLDVKP